MGIRKNYRNLTDVERDLFVQALFHVKSNGIIDEFARIHAKHFNMGIHRSSHFLPWHREMLLRFERELQKFHPDITIPYWDSTIDRSPSDPLWNNNFLGQFNSAWSLTRALGSDLLPTPQQVKANQERKTYDVFWPELERDIHNHPHVWVGGVMVSMASPGDPVFYLHHCWIDMLWARWQLAPETSGAPFVSSGTGVGLNDPMMEWPDRTPADVLDHHALGYHYDTEPVLPTGPAAQGDDMQPGEVLNPDQSITSANGRYRFIYQGDGNLVLYDGGQPLWASATDGRSVGACIMQGDGNLVVYGRAGEYVWDSASDGNAGSRLVVQDDGNVVIYRPDGAPVWATNTWLPVGVAA